LVQAIFRRTIHGSFRLMVGARDKGSQISSDYRTALAGPVT
jgi:hypothetical protein